MVNAQEWLQYKFSNKEKWQIIKEIDARNNGLEGDLDLRSFEKLKEINISGNPQLGEIINPWGATIIDINEINAQEWLNNKYSNKEAVEEIILEQDKQLINGLIIQDYPRLEKIIIVSKKGVRKWLSEKLTGLKVVNCPQLVELNCCGNEISWLDITDCSNLKELDCSDNLLSSLDLSKNGKLEKLDIGDNEFRLQDLTFLSRLVNLRELSLGNSNKEKIQQGIANYFTGSLEPLKNMSELEKLDISETGGINSGLEYLPESIEEFYCLTKHRSSAIVNLLTKNEQATWGVNYVNLSSDGRIIDFSRKLRKFKLEKIREQAKSHIKVVLNREGISQEQLNQKLLNDGHLTPNQTWQNCLETYSVSTQKKIILDTIQILKIQTLSSQSIIYFEQSFQENNIAQVDFWQELKKQCRVDSKLTDWKDYLKTALSPDNLNIKKENALAVLEICKKKVHSQDWLNWNYPSEVRKELKELDISSERLKGKLDLSDFVNLEKLNCHQNQLTSLDTSKCSNLVSLNCSRNQITSLDLNIQLVELDCSDNKLEKIDLINSRNLININFSNNRLTSLDLSNCSNIVELDCQNNLLAALVGLNAEKLERLNCSNNNLPKQDLSFFKNFINLKYLSIGTSDEKRIQQSIYNRFHGSLEPLKKLTKLEELNINNTDLDSGLEYLPLENLNQFYCSADDNYRFDKEKLEKYLKQQKQLETKLETLAHSISQEQNTTQLLETKIQDLQSELIQQKEVNQQNIQQLQVQIKIKENELNKVLKETTSSVFILRREITTLQKKLKQIEKERIFILEKLEKQIQQNEKFQEIKNKLERDKKELQKITSSFQEKLLFSNEEIRKFTQRVEQLEKSLTENQKANQKSQEQITNLEAKIKEDKKILIIREQLDSKKISLQEIEEQVRDLESQLDSKKSSAEKLRQEVIQLEKQLEHSQETQLEAKVEILTYDFGDLLTEN